MEWSLRVRAARELNAAHKNALLSYSISTKAIAIFTVRETHVHFRRIYCEKALHITETERSSG